jgi:hypothetical protein
MIACDLLHCTKCASADYLMSVWLQVPLKYANRSIAGLEYLVSFGIGAALVTATAAAAYSVAAARRGW